MQRRFLRKRSAAGIPLPSKPAALPPVPHSVADATSLPGRGESVQGDGFSSGGKLCGSAKRRPLGGAGCERSEQTEGGSPGKRPRPLSQALSGLPALPKGEPLAWRESYRVNCKVSGFTRGSPFGGAVAQRLRGYKSAEPEKTVKRSSRRTGVNLQFFPVGAHFFRIVKGEQPLARCGVGGVQR